MIHDVASVTSDPLIGQVLEDRYVIESRIARGGMAVVYQGVDQRLHRPVAIKVMHSHLVDDADFRKRFETEARSAAKLTHPNLVSVLDQGDEHPIVYLVMEYLPGITLRDLLKEQGFLTVSQTLEISEAVLKGLSAAHDAGIIHRDLKPENVILADDGRIKLADFGLARAAGNNTTTGQALLGTVAYLSPELITRGTADKRSDIYAFGIMLYEMITGSQPFKGEQPMQVAYQHAHDEMPLPSSKSTESTPWLDELVRWATRKNPEERPPDARELLRALMRGGSATDVFKTSVLPSDSLTTVLPSAPQSSDSHKPQSSGDADPTNASHFASQNPNLARAKSFEKKRRLKGFLTTLVVLFVISGSAGFSYWNYLGPGADVSVPEVVGDSVDDALQKLEDVTLIAEVKECFDVVVPVGHVVSVDPVANTRVKKESSVVICESLGPEELPVPSLVGMQVSDAEKEIEKSKFIYLGVYEEVFDEAPEGQVLAAVTEDGDPLPEVFPEQSGIALIASAGYVPNPTSLSIADAVSQLESVGLTVDQDSFNYSHSSEIEKDHVINLVTFSNRLRMGDSVSLHISLGPELFEVPDVSGMTVREAVDVLREYGFDPNPPWYMNENAYDSFKVKSTSPKAGKMVEAGTTIDISAKIL